MENGLSIVTAISMSTLVLVYQTQDLQLVSYAFTAFGKAVITQKKLHPDTFVQLALQLAYYRKHKRYGPVKNLAMPLLVFEVYEVNDSACLFFPLSGQVVAMRQQ